MSASIRSLPLMLALGGCASGDWVVTTWGEEFIEDGIPASEFGDGCSATYDSFEVEFTSANLLRSDETIVAESAVGRFELTDPGPQELGVLPVRADTYDRVYYGISPDSGDSVRAAGTVTCGEDTVSFDWSFDASTTYRCLPLEVAVPANGDFTTELTIHGDHLFFDSLDEDGGTPMGLAMIAADADEDGELTMAELEAVDVSAIGYDVANYTSISDLAEFVTTLVQSVGHVDGEGHCYVDG